MKYIVMIVVFCNAMMIASDIQSELYDYLPILSMKEVADTLESGNIVINQSNIDSQNKLIHKAAEFNRREIVSVLINYGADLNVKGCHGASPLHCVYDQETTKIFLQHGANIDAKNKNKCSPLVMAARRGNTEIAKVLLHYGINVDTALYDAMRFYGGSQQEDNIIKELLFHGANLYKKDAQGVSPFDFIKKYSPERQKKLKQLIANAQERLQ